MSHNARKSFFKLTSLLITTLIFVGCGKNADTALLPLENLPVDGKVTDNNIIIGDLDWKEITSLPVRDLKRRNGAKVGKLDIPVIGSRCTAFLISDDVVMTNHHCIPNSSYAQGVKVQFKYEKGSTDLEEYDCSEFIGNDRVLDYALLRCNGSPGRKLGEVRLATVAAVPSASIYVIQQNCDYYMESGCDPTKKISFGTITEIDDEYTHSADTLGGSSGSPVFSRNTNQVLAIHHAGLGNNGLGRGIENYAVPMHKIVTDIKANFPGILSSSSGGSNPTPNLPTPTPPVSSRPTSIAKAKLLFSGSSVRDKLSVSEKVHYYKINVSRTKSVSVSLFLNNRVGDLDLFVYNSMGRIVAKSTSTSNKESIVKTLSKGSYYIKVSGYRGATGNYRIVTFN